MRTLKFIVDGQTIKEDPTCNFKGLIPGSEGYVKAEFSFSPEWDGCVKVVAFFSRLGIEYEPQPLMNSNACIIPIEALRKRIFKIQVIGQRLGYKICTNRLEVKQEGDKE